MPWDAVNAVGSCAMLIWKVTEFYRLLWDVMQCCGMLLEVAHGCGKLWMVAGVEYCNVVHVCHSAKFAKRLERLLNNVDNDLGCCGMC